MDLQTQGKMEMTVAMALSGTIGIFAYFSGLSEFAIVLWRCIMGSTVLLLVCWRRGYLSSHSLSRRSIILALFGGAALLANWLFLFAAYRRASISISGLVYNLQPFILASLSAWILHERIRRDHIVWACVGLAGLAIVAFAGLDEGVDNEFLIGLGCAVCAAFFYALAALSAKLLRGMPPHLVALIQFAAGSIVLLPLIGSSLPPGNLASITSIATLGIVHTGFMYILLYGAFQKLNPGTAAALAFINPVVTILSEALILHRSFTTLQYFGGGIILLAVLGTTAFRRQDE
ncbi:EamA family transporter [Pleomorphomonas diazotrophica]|uniref:EamA family transporter n=1 Tax=Pleomorphomonas diazotrophica TaxID=1166257 RepID=A0A1I4Q483_9HYPH|nr:DMT family transporter [Pleomorphomonas diazotrophica]PKR90946.1 EamA family transporter [Pleomorphomonas diazotrophica]SFM34889.1 Threonine/homoserine efflux transporter RhtA [Pleomorphomonas diazotrophica]